MYTYSFHLSHLHALTKQFSHTHFFFLKTRDKFSEFRGTHTLSLTHTLFLLSDTCTHHTQTHFSRITPSLSVLLRSNVHYYISCRIDFFFCPVSHTHGISNENNTLKFSLIFKHNKHRLHYKCINYGF